jgi:hypothetical protein
VDFNSPILSVERIVSPWLGSTTVARLRIAAAAWQKVSSRSRATSSHITMLSKTRKIAAAATLRESVSVLVIDVIGSASS